MRGPETEEEKTGGAGRVEGKILIMHAVTQAMHSDGLICCHLCRLLLVSSPSFPYPINVNTTVYTCKLCKTETTFPRFNSPRTLFKSRRGRCGEFANLFGTYCRALGFDTRYILDFTDHVWTEVWSVRQQRWLHADSCEGLIDRPNMYEQGWGKKLNYAIGATHDHCADVTKRYTRKLYSDEFQARRREFAPDENTSDRVFLQMSGALRQMNSIGKGRLEELEKRGKAEENFFGMVQSSGVWDVEYREGRSKYFSLTNDFFFKVKTNPLVTTYCRLIL